MRAAHANAPKYPPTPLPNGPSAPIAVTVPSAAVIWFVKKTEKEWPGCSGSLPARNTKLRMMRYTPIATEPIISAIRPTVAAMLSTFVPE